ncbi:MAG: purine-nucleoside phosphorylase [Nitrospirae bacterium RBG_19FT_COMBO_42_15]|nr:MAG: purine-nucleoside phosphorylase [Nitrospirae bacterium RBG_19FT_COMBO_42_15]
MPAKNKKISQTLKFLKSRIKLKPEIGIILGSGFGDIADIVRDKQIIPYSKIGNFPVSTVKGHKGNLVFGRIANKPVVIMQGRVHYYEGYSIDDVAFPARVIAGLGAKALIVTTSVGGINKRFKKGDFMIINDHINLMPENPLRGKRKDVFIDMCDAYDKVLQEIAVKAGKKIGLKLSKGVLAALSGPSYETPAEINMLRRLGADAVCMSTVPEVIMARYLHLSVLGIALISNMAAGISPKPLSHADVVQAGKERMKEAACLIEGIVKEI